MTSTAVIVVTGVPGAFCAGTDLADLATVPGETRGLRGAAEEREKWWPLAAGAQADGLRDRRAGGRDGCRVHARSATSGSRAPNARFAWNFVHRGLVPDTGAGTWLLPRIVGLPARAAAAVHRRDDRGRPGARDRLRARRRGERRAAPRGDGPGQHDRRRFPAQPRVDQVAGARRARRARRRAHGAPHAALAACFKSDDHREGVASFLERRPANFTGT